MKIQNKTLLFLSITSLGILLSACGDSDSTENQSEKADEQIISIQSQEENSSILYKNIVYEELISPLTKRVWLDRNLGASRVCETFDDETCYGDYYQWGRMADGHEKEDHNNSSVLSTDVTVVGHSDFIITEYDAEPNDWAHNTFSDGSIRSQNYLQSDGTSICPIAFRVPTIEELDSEFLDANNSSDVFYTALKIPTAGYRPANTGTTYLKGKYGSIWSSSIDGLKSKHLGFGKDYIQKNNTTYRGNAFSIRCIKD